MMFLGGKRFRPAGSGNQQPQRPKINQSVAELMKPLSEKTWKGNVWGSVIMNVEKESGPQPTTTTTTTTPPFSPTSLSGGIYYNNYTDSSKMVLDTSGGQTTIASVIDGFTGSTLFSQPTKAFQPLYVNHNGKNTAVALPTQFQGGLYSNLDMPQEYTMFAIVDNVSGSGGNMMYSIADAGASWANQTAGRHHQFKIISTGTNYAIGFNSSESPTLPNAVITQNTGWHLVIMRNRISGGSMITELFDGSSTPIASGTESSPGSSYTNKGIMVASSNGGYYAPIAEQGMYNRALTDSEITQLANYFTSNY